MLINTYKIQDKNMADRFRFIEHAGKEILLMDYSHADREACFALTAEFERYIQTREADGSLRILFDMETPYYDPIHANHWRANSARYDKYFHSTAMIHAGPIIKLVLSSLRMYLKMLGQPMTENRGRIFESKDAALDFLSGN
jgi:hypothetical protein